MDNAVLGIFTYVDPLLSAVDKLRSDGHKIKIISSVPLVHEIEHKFGEEETPLQFFTFFGALFGMIFGTIIALGTAALYILPRGGRAIFPVTPTLIISYETAILMGVCMSFLGFLVLTKLPTYFSKKANDPQVAVDKFGLLVEGLSQDSFDEIEAMLSKFGASEVKRVEEA
jgi:hypothetical protein